MSNYFDPAISDEEIGEHYPRLMADTGRLNPHKTRDYLLQKGFDEDNIVRYWYRPMDVRWLYWEPETKLLDEKRSEFQAQVFSGNRFLAIHHTPRREWTGPQVTHGLGDYVLFDPSTSYFPLYLNPQAAVGDLFNQPSADGEDGEPIPNLSDAAADYLDRMGGTVETLFYHTIATLHAPAYSRENEGALRDIWPRVPLPQDGDLLRESAELGREVAALLDVEQDVDGVDDGTVREELRPLGRPEHVEPDAALDPNTDFAVTAGWGYVIPPSTVMPNNGEIDRRSYTPAEEAVLPEQGLERWGGETLDLYLNENARWANVPERIWDYTLGGYPVIKKWLSYREKDVLGRDLKPDEVRHVKHMVRRIAALLLLEPQLDANYETVKAAT
jgi:hypothetical protein